jgi:hypothetical protein
MSDDLSEHLFDDVPLEGAIRDATASTLLRELRDDVSVSHLH